MSEKHVVFCKCGQEFIVETGVAGSFRRDGKRVYPSGAGHEFTDYFRCPTCAGFIGVLAMMRGEK